MPVIMTTFQCNRLKNKILGQDAGSNTFYEASAPNYWPSFFYSEEHHFQSDPEEGNGQEQTLSVQ